MISMKKALLRASRGWDYSRDAGAKTAGHRQVHRGEKGRISAGGPLGFLRDTFREPSMEVFPLQEP